MLDIILGILLLVAALFLVIAVLFQSGKSHGLSGTIAGGAETFFGKTKGKTMDKFLSKATTVVAIVFVILVLFVYVIQDDTDLSALYNDYVSSLDTTAEVTTTTDDTDGTTDASDTTAADTTASADTTAAVTTAADGTAAAETTAA